MKKIFLFTLNLLSSLSIKPMGLIGNRSMIDYGNSTPRPSANQSATLYYYPDKVSVINQTITPDPSNPLPVNLDISDDTVEKVIQKIIENGNQTAQDNASELKETWQTLVGTLFNSENAIRFGYPVALFFVVGISGFYGARVAWKVIENNLVSPKLGIFQR